MLLFLLLACIQWNLKGLMGGEYFTTHPAHLFGRGHGNFGGCRGDVHVLTDDVRLGITPWSGRFLYMTCFRELIVYRCTVGSFRFKKGLE